MARLRRRTIDGALTILLMLVFIVSADSNMVSHDPVALTAIVADHAQENPEHDHLHENEEPDSLLHAFYGHAHDAADHDHNPVFLFLNETSGSSLTKPARLLAAETRLRRRTVFDLEKPPRG